MKRRKDFVFIQTGATYGTGRAKHWPMRKRLTKAIIKRIMGKAAK